MSFKAGTCQNDFLRSPLVLFSAILRIRLILVFCVTISLLWIQGENTCFLWMVFYYLAWGEMLLLFLKRKWCVIPLILGCRTPVLRPSPRYDSHLQVYCALLKLFLRLGPTAVIFLYITAVAGSLLVGT